jgi:hypothetical protein
MGTTTRGKSKRKTPASSAKTADKNAKSADDADDNARRLCEMIGFKFDDKGNCTPPDGWTFDTKGRPVQIAPVAVAQEPAAKRPKVASAGESLAPRASDSGQSAAQITGKSDKTDAAVAAALAKRSKKESKANKEMVKMIKCEVKTKAWRICKFQNGPNQRRKATTFVLNLLNLPNYQADVPADSGRREEWIRGYENEVCKAINEVRNYVQGRIMDDCAYPWIRAHGGKLPSKERMKALNIRDLDPEKPEDFELWKWWHTKVMARACGHRAGWDPNKNQYLTIGKGAPPDDPKKPYIPPTTEGIAQVIFENNRDKWPATVKLMDSDTYPTGATYRPTGTVKRNKDDSLFFQHELKQTRKGPVVWMNDPIYHGKYSLTDCGQQSDSGWSAEGRLFFQDATKENQAARKTPKFHKVEAKMLAKLKKELGITGNSPEEQAAIESQEKKRTSQKEVCEGLEEMEYEEEEDLELEDDDEATVGEDDPEAGSEGGGEE